MASKRQEYADLITTHLKRAKLPDGYDAIQMRKGMRMVGRAVSGVTEPR